MHLLQNSPDNRGTITLCDTCIRLLQNVLARMLSGGAFRSNLGRGVANTDVDSDNIVLTG